MSSFSALHWAILAAILFVVWKAARALFPRKSAPTVCTTCGHHGPAAVKTRGSFLIEVVLWLCFIIPGLIYSLWRVATRGNVCSACGAATIFGAIITVALGLAGVDGARLQVAVAPWPTPSDQPASAGFISIEILA